MELELTIVPQSSTRAEGSSSLAASRSSNNWVASMLSSVSSSLLKEALPNPDDRTDYSGALFQNSLGFDANLSGLMAGFLNTWFFLASFIPWFLIDRLGRRPLVSGNPLLAFRCGKC